IRSDDVGMLQQIQLLKYCNILVFSVLYITNNVAHSLTCLLVYMGPLGIAECEL
ncbi:hypothetical protein GOP47_0002108, partial [Adiantum capillus-veneris]